MKNNTIRPALWLQKNTVVMILRAKNWVYALNEDTSQPTFPAQWTPGLEGILHQTLARNQSSSRTHTPLKKSRMHKIKIRSSRKNLLVDATMPNLVYIPRLEIWCGWLFPDVFSSGSMQPAQLALQERSRILTAKRSPGGKRGLKSPLSRAALHPTSMERVPVLCHPPYMSPTGFCSFPRPAEQTAPGNARGHVHRTEDLTCGYRNLGFFVLQRIKPVSIPRASGAGFDLGTAFPNL